MIFMPTAADMYIREKKNRDAKTRVLHWRKLAVYIRCVRKIFSNYRHSTSRCSNYGKVETDKTNDRCCTSCSNNYYTLYSGRIIELYRDGNVSFVYTEQPVLI